MRRLSREAGSPGSFWGAVANLPDYLQQLVGVLGWGETYLPFPVYVLVDAMVAFLVIGALLLRLATPRRR